MRSLLLVQGQRQMGSHLLEVRRERIRRCQGHLSVHAEGYVMGNNGRPDQETLITLGKSSFDGIALARANTQNLADRIAAVLDERRRIGEQRRQRERESLLRQAERAQVREHRGREPKGSNRLVRDLDALCVAVISRNAANEVMKEYAILDAVEIASGSENAGACGNACI